MDWTHFLFLLSAWLLGLWILIARASSGASLLKVNVVIFVFSLIALGVVVYRAAERLFRPVAVDDQLPADAERDRVSELETSAQSIESWVCSHCGKPTPMDYGACIHCGHPSGTLR